MVLPLLLVVVAAAPASPDAFRSGWSELRAAEARLNKTLLYGGTDLARLSEEDRRLFRADVASFVERLERLKPPPELARCHRYAIAAGKSIPPLVMSMPPPAPTDPATGWINPRPKSRPIEEREAASARASAIFRPFQALAAARRVCGIGDLPPEPGTSRGVIDTWFYFARPPWLTELEPADAQYLEAWSALQFAETMIGTLLEKSEPGAQEYRGMDEYWEFVAEAASTLSKQRPAPAFATCHAQALEASERLERALRALAPTVEPAIAGDDEPFDAARRVAAQHLHALDDARMVCGIYFPGAQ